MNSENTRPTLRRAWIAAALLIATVVAFGASYDRAEAVVIAGPHVCAYYSDATFTTVVGARGVGCCGAVISWGLTSKYVRCEQLLCPDVVCPN